MTTTINQINGWFKTSYADKMTDLTPDNVYYVRQGKELESELQPGGGYSVPVTLTSEQGITKASARAGAFALNPPIGMSSRQTSIEGSQFLLRSALDYETVFRSKNKNAFISATKGVIKNMAKSAYFYQEVDFLYGRSNIGVLSGVAGNTVTISVATWAAGLWRGSENRRLRVQTAGGVLRGTCQVTGYNVNNREVTVDALPAGTVATDTLWFEADGASGANCMVGLVSAITGQTGDLWGINRSDWGLWRSAGTFSAGNAPLSFNRIMRALVQGENHGMGDDINEIEVVVSSGGWTDLGNDLAALRAIDSSYKTTEAANGSESIVFHAPVGKVHIVTHKMMKNGISLVHPKVSRWLEIVGAQPKPTFKLPGMVAQGEDQYLRPMENNAGLETRVYWNAAAFTTMINQSLVITDIVNAA